MTDANTHESADDKPLRFASEKPAGPSSRRKPWKLLVVDDEKEVHTVTHLALNDFVFGNHPLEIISAYSGEEAKRIMSEESDIAIILLDVVMETDQAGLDVVRYIREDLQNHFVRIILRTGQPGQAPEYQVITEYDINDYKHKTELTREKMFTLVHTSLSGYRDLMALDANRRGLEKVIEASACIFELRSMDRFTQGVLEQLTALLYLEQDAVVLKTAGLAALSENNHMQIVAATGRYSGLVGKDAYEVLDEDLVGLIKRARQEQRALHGDNYYVDFHRTTSGTEHIMYACGNSAVSVPDMHLMDLFSRNVAIAHENVQLMVKPNQAGSTQA